MANDAATQAGLDKILQTPTIEMLMNLNKHHSNQLMKLSCFSLSINM